MAYVSDEDDPFAHYFAALPPSKPSQTAVSPLFPEEQEDDSDDDTNDEADGDDDDDDDDDDNGDDHNLSGEDAALMATIMEHARIAGPLTIVRSNSLDDLEEGDIEDEEGGRGGRGGGDQEPQEAWQVMEARVATLRAITGLQHEECVVLLQAYHTTERAVASYFDDPAGGVATAQRLIDGAAATAADYDATNTDTGPEPLSFDGGGGAAAATRGDDSDIGGSGPLLLPPPPPGQRLGRTRSGGLGSGAASEEAMASLRELTGLEDDGALRCLLCAYHSVERAAGLYFDDADKALRHARQLDRTAAEDAKFVHSLREVGEDYGDDDGGPSGGGGSKSSPSVTQEKRWAAEEAVVATAKSEALLGTKTGLGPMGCQLLLQAHDGNVKFALRAFEEAPDVAVASAAQTISDREEAAKAAAARQKAAARAARTNHQSPHAHILGEMQRPRAVEGRGAGGGGGGSGSGGGSDTYFDATEHWPDFLERLEQLFATSDCQLTRVEKLPHTSRAADFLNVWRREGRSCYPTMVFHGTHAANISGIARSGMRIPGRGGVRVLNGSAFGVGIYTARAPRISLGYTSGHNQMFACAALMGETSVTASKRPFITAGDILVYFQEERVFPCFLCTFNQTPTTTPAAVPDNFKSTKEDRKHGSICYYARLVTDVEKLRKQNPLTKSYPDPHGTVAAAASGSTNTKASKEDKKKKKKKKTRQARFNAGGGKKR